MYVALTRAEYATQISQVRDYLESDTLGPHGVHTIELVQVCVRGKGLSVTL